MLSMLSAISGLLTLAVNGTIALVTMNKEIKEKLIKVYLEVLHNKSVLKNSGCLEISPLAYANKFFVSAVKQLKNKEIIPLYKFNTKSVIVPNSKKEEKRRKTQYAINYVITQIDDLKNIVTVKRGGKVTVRPALRIKTLAKHLDTLEKVLSPLGKEKNKGGALIGSMHS